MKTDWKKYSLTLNDWLQVKTFKEIFRKNIKLGLCNEAAFIDAITLTTDTVFSNLTESARKKLKTKFFS